MNIEIGPQELEYLKAFKHESQKIIDFLDENNNMYLYKEAYKDVSIQEKCRIIKSNRDSEVFWRMALQWLDKVIS